MIVFKVLDQLSEPRDFKRLLHVVFNVVFVLLAFRIAFVFLVFITVPVALPATPSLVHGIVLLAVFLAVLLDVLLEIFGLFIAISPAIEPVAFLVVSSITLLAAPSNVKSLLNVPLFKVISAAIIFFITALSCRTSVRVVTREDERSRDLTYIIASVFAFTFDVVIGID